MKPRQDVRWPDAHIRLKKLYEQRVPSGMSQEEFGQEFGLGSQGMVWQYLNGYTPLNYDAASKFAEGLRCSIKDISPEMDKSLHQRILPAMGLKAWRRAAALALAFLIAPYPSPSEANASHVYLYTSYTNAVYYVKLLKRLVARLSRFCAASLQKDVLLMTFRTAG